MAGGSGEIYDFGPFRLLAEEGVLLHDGQPVHLTPKVIKTLQVLVENHGHLVEKETLIKRVWPDTFVHEENLSYNISMLRKALDDGTNGQTYIETIPRRGYRFVAAVRRPAQEEVTIPNTGGTRLPEAGGRNQRFPAHEPLSRARQEESGPTKVASVWTSFGRVWRHWVVFGVAVVAVVLAWVGYHAYLGSRPEQKSHRADAFLREGLVHQASGKPWLAETAFQKARELYAAAGNSAGEVEALTDMGYVLRTQGELAQAMSTYESALAISRRIGAQKAIANLLKGIGNILHVQGRFADAQNSYDSALAIFQQLGDKSDVAVIFKDMGNVAPTRAQAEKDYERALAIFREIGDRHGAASALDDIGVELDAEGYLAGARKVFEEEVSTWREIGEQGYLGVGTANLGDVLYEQGALGEATEQLTESLRIQRQFNRTAVPWALRDLGAALLQQDQSSEARKAFEEALALAYELGNKGDVADGRLVLARLALAEDRPAEAEAQARQAEEQSRLTRALDIETRAWAVLAQALADEGKSRAAQSMAKEKLLPKLKDAPCYFYGDRLWVRITAGRVLATTGDDSAGSRILESAWADALRLGYGGYQLEARLGLSEIRARSGRGKTELEALAAEANAKGFKLIARKAAALLSHAQTDRPSR